MSPSLCEQSPDEGTTPSVTMDRSAASDMIPEEQETLTVPNFHQQLRDENQILPVDLMILIFMHLSRHPQDLLNCALTVRQWTRPALQELYRHPWSYLFTYQFETEGRVMDKHGSMLLLRTLFQGCMDPTKTLLPYATFARSVNLKWVQDTFDLPEVNIQTLTGFRWTRNETPKDFLIRHLLISRPYLNDFVHCLSPRLPRCLFANFTTNSVNNLFAAAEDMYGNVDAEAEALVAAAATSEDGMVVLEGTGEADEEAIATGSSSQSSSASTSTLPTESAPAPARSADIHDPFNDSLPIGISSSDAGPIAEIATYLIEEEMAQDVIVEHETTQGLLEATMTETDADEGSSSSSATVHTFAFQQPFVPEEESAQHSRVTSSSSSSSSSLESTCRLFLSLWPLTMEQTQSLVYVDLRFATVTDSLIATLAFTCHRIESLKIATHWQAFPETYSVTDPALASFVRSQTGIKLFHVENHREISQGHELVHTIDVLTRQHGATLETLVLQSHDFQNCNLAALGKACQRLRKFSAPGGAHIFREEIVKLADECKLTLEHLDFSNSDIETEALRQILKNTATPEAARGVLKALVLLGMEDMLNEATCQAIGEFGVGLDCFRLDILESEAKDVSMMLSGPCSRNLKVLTLGCHDVHGDLAIDILEQIAQNCSHLEMLDVNHWQFSASAIEKVLRQCRMLRYLNISYTNVGESTAKIIARCLGEIKKATQSPTSKKSSTSSSTPTSANTLLVSLLQTNTMPIATVSAPIVEEIVEDDEEDVFAEEEAEISWEDELDWEMQVEADVPVASDTAAVAAATAISTTTSVAQTVSTTLMDEDERADSMKKRGRAKDDDGEEEEDAAIEMALFPERDTLYEPSSYSSSITANKKQSQIGLVHHLSNAMDLRTIMNLDLDEAIDMDLSMSVDEVTGMDLDMSLDLERYRRKSSSKAVVPVPTTIKTEHFKEYYQNVEDDDDEEGAGNDEREEKEKTDFDENDNNDGITDVEMAEDMALADKNDDLSYPRSHNRDVKGKGVYIEREPLFVPDSYFSSPTMHYSSSFGSTSSSASCSSSSSASSSKFAPNFAPSSAPTSVISSSSNGQAMFSTTTAEATLQEPIQCNPLLPSLPIPSKQSVTTGTVHNGDEVLTIATVSSPSSLAVDNCSDNLLTPAQAIFDASKANGPSAFVTPLCAHATTSKTTLTDSVSSSSSSSSQPTTIPVADPALLTTSSGPIPEVYSHADMIIESEPPQVWSEEVQGVFGLMTTSILQELDDDDLFLPEVPTGGLIEEIEDGEEDDDERGTQVEEDGEVRGEVEEDDEPFDESLLMWTRSARLEQVHIECCSQLSVTTMSHLRTLIRARQQAQLHPSSMAPRPPSASKKQVSAPMETGREYSKDQGENEEDEAEEMEEEEEAWIPRGRSRVWAENEHDMMMTRLEMERGPFLTLRPIATELPTLVADYDLSTATTSTAATTEINAVTASESSSTAAALPVTVPVPESESELESESAAPESEQQFSTDSDITMLMVQEPPESQDNVESIQSMDTSPTTEVDTSPSAIEVAA
ncbi:hypothetical protein BGZ83_004422 [Gryganskiella cystojenkinii]|nr:hypothetical protein BGZ83_004422 [Gryganskiella cystojenkinii]